MNQQQYDQIAQEAFNDELKKLAEEETAAEEKTEGAEHEKKESASEEKKEHEGMKMSKKERFLEMIKGKKHGKKSKIEEVKEAAFNDELNKIALSKEEFNKIDKMHSAHEKKHWPAYASNVASLTAGGAAGSAGGYLLGKKLFNNVKGVK